MDELFSPDWISFLFAGIFVLIAGICLIIEKIFSEIKRGTWAIIRTTAQLILVGYILEYVFNVNNVFLILIILAIMILIGAWTASGRIKLSRKQTFPVVSLGIFVSTALILVILLGGIVRADPWYNPQYLIPLAGMITGNAMNAASLGAERLRSEILLRRKEIEMWLLLGAHPSAASANARKEALKAALTPIMNSMMVVGVVSLPGAMTGLILGGTDPKLASIYQIIVMLMIFAGNAAAAFISVRILSRKAFNKDYYLNPDWLS